MNTKLSGKVALLFYVTLAMDMTALCSEDPNIQLRDACIANNLDLVKLALASKADANFIDQKYVVVQGRCLNHLLSVLNSSPTPLRIASYNGNLEIVKELLMSGARVNGVTRSLYSGTMESPTPLAQAISSGYAEIVKILILANASLDVSGSGIYSLMQLAAQSGRLDILKLLVHANVSVDAKNSFLGFNALSIALESNYIDMYKFLILSGANFSDASSKIVCDRLGINKESGTLILSACKIKEPGFFTDLIIAAPSIASLLNNQAHIEIANFADNMQMTALMHAVLVNNLDMINYLLIYNDRCGELDIAAENENGDNALQFALNRNNASVCKLFAKHNDKFFKIIEDVTPLKGPIARLVIRLLHGQNSLFVDLEKIENQQAASSRCVLQ